MVHKEILYMMVEEVLTDIPMISHVKPLLAHDWRLPPILSWKDLESGYSLSGTEKGEEICPVSPTHPDLAKGEGRSSSPQSHFWRTKK